MHGASAEKEHRTEDDKVKSISLEKPTNSFAEACRRLISAQAMSICDSTSRCSHHLDNARDHFPFDAGARTPLCCGVGVLHDLPDMLFFRVSNRKKT